MTNNLPKVFVFGAGVTGNVLLPEIIKNYQVIAFLDNDKFKWGTSINQSINQSIPILNPNVILEPNLKYDAIIVTVLSGMSTITTQLLDMGVERVKIITEYIDFFVKSRIMFLECLKEIFKDRDISGCVAEGGVFQGEFAQQINRIFPQSKFYLFDTFDGFDKRDINVEQNNSYSKAMANDFGITSEQLVLSKLPYPDMCVLKKGYFPETAEGIDEQFCFVNLDFDLYNPILAGLEFFVPRMVSGGVILIHDYFNSEFQGVKKAVKDFENKVGKLNLFPIGDGYSIAIQC